MKNKFVKLLISIMAISTLICSMSACNSSNNNNITESSKESVVESTQVSEVKVDYTTTPYLIIKDDSFLEKPFVDQYQENSGFLTQKMIDNSIQIKAYDNYITEEDRQNAEELKKLELERSNGEDVSIDPKLYDAKMVLCISKDAKSADRLTELNPGITITKDDYSECKIVDKDGREMILKTGLTDAGELYIIMENNMVAMQDYTGSISPN